MKLTLEQKADQLKKYLGRHYGRGWFHAVGFRTDRVKNTNKFKVFKIDRSKNLESPLREKFICIAKINEFALVALQNGFKFENDKYEPKMFSEMDNQQFKIIQFFPKQKLTNY